MRSSHHYNFASSLCKLKNTIDFLPILLYCNSYFHTERANHMPQMSKGGKFIFEKSLIRGDLTIHLPAQAVTEYNAIEEGKVYLFTGSKVTGGFCVTRKGLLEFSKLGHILTDNPALLNYQTAESEFLPYKGRSYCWVSISEDAIIQLTDEMMNFLNLKIGMELLSIRSSNIAFTMGAKGPLLEKSENFEGEIRVY